MKITVCSLNARYIHSSLAPWCLLAGIGRYGDTGLEAVVVEGTINQQVDELLERLLDTKADVFAFCCYIWNIRLVRTLAYGLKEACPDAIIVLGGPEATHRSEELLNSWPVVEYINRGEGEYPFACLMNALLRGKDIESVPGLAYRRGGKLCIQPPFIAAGDPPRPYSAAYDAALQGRIAYLETSRGCPFSCAFCLSGRQETVRFFDLATAKEELLHLANSGAKTVKLVDRTFNCQTQRAYELFAFIVEEAGGRIPAGVCFHFEVAADLFDDRTLRLLAAAPPGLIQLEAGLQSFHKETLEAVTRRTDMERLHSNLRRLLEPGNIHVHIDLIAGLPYEDFDTFGRSFDLAYALQPHMLQLGFLKLLHGSRLRRDAALYGYRCGEEAPYEIEESRWIDKEELKRLHGVEDALERLYNSGRFRLTLAYLLKVMACRPFSLFLGFSAYLADKDAQRVSLDQYTALMWSYFSVQRGVEAAVLRDAMACDILQGVRGGRLPVCLQRRDKRLQQLKRAITASLPPAERTIPRSVILLESLPGTAVTAEYACADPVTGHYPLRRLYLEEWLES